MDMLLPNKAEPISKLIKRSVYLYRVSLIRVFGLALLLSIAAFLPRIISTFIGQDIFYRLPIFSEARLWLILVDIASLFFFTAIVWRLNCITIGKRESFKQDFTKAFKKFPSIFVAALLQMGLLLLLGIFTYGFGSLLNKFSLLATKDLTIVFFVTGTFFLQVAFSFYLYFLFYFYLPLIALENDSILQSIKQSVFLVWNNWWRTLIVQMTPWLGYLLVLMFVKYVLMIDLHIYFFGISELTFPTTLLHILLFALFIPWAAAAMLVQLKDLEIRHPS